MTRSIAARLQQLEGRRPHCATCRAWHEPVPVRTMTPQEADADPGLTRPAICPDCGRPVPAQILAIIVDGTERERA